MDDWARSLGSMDGTILRGHVLKSGMQLSIIRPLCFLPTNYLKYLRGDIPVSPFLTDDALVVGENDDDVDFIM